MGFNLRRKEPDHEVFERDKQIVKLWLQGLPTSEIVLKIGLPRQLVESRILALRHAGVKIPKRGHSYNGVPVRVEELNRYIDSLTTPNNGKTGPTSGSEPSSTP